MIGRPNFNHPFARAIIDRVKESLVVYQQRMRGVVVSVSADGKSAVVRRFEEPATIQKKPYINTVAGLLAGDEVVCMVDRGGGVITGVVGGKAAPVSGGTGGGGVVDAGVVTASKTATTYPDGMSYGDGRSGSGFPQDGVLVITHRYSNTRTFQEVFHYQGTGMWTRYWDAVSGIWSAFTAR